MRQKPTANTRYALVDGTITPLLRSRVRDVLVVYGETAKFWADKRPSPIENFRIREINLIGSFLRGVDNSDLDLLILPDKIDNEDYRFFKQVLSQTFYNNRNKVDAIDVFVRPVDEFPERVSLDITPQVKDLIDRCNESLHREGLPDF